MKRVHERRVATVLGSVLAMACGVTLIAAFPNTAAAKPNVDRQGLQSSWLLGASMCIPGEAKCRYAESDTDAFAHGSTRPSFGLGKELGFRMPWLFIGAVYNFGLFDTRWDVVGSDNDYRRAYQHSVMGVIRPTLPLWRFDLGVDIAPGWSRQVFRYEANRNRDYTQGFAFKTGLLLAFFVTKRIQIGAKADFIFNFHSTRCARAGDTITCQKPEGGDVMPMHQMIVGVHLSRVFF